MKVQEIQNAVEKVVGYPKYGQDEKLQVLAMDPNPALPIFPTTMGY